MNRATPDTRGLRLGCRAKKSRPPKPVFHIGGNMPASRQVTLADAELAMETCMNIPDTSRDECYVAFGVDGDAVEEYFYIVEKLEKAFKKAPTLPHDAKN